MKLAANTLHVRSRCHRLASAVVCIAVGMFSDSPEAQTINTYMGGGVGDGAPAIYAQVLPSDVVFDESGDLYIAEASANRVRKMTSGGIITTIAGIGQFGFGYGCGLGLAAYAVLSGPSAIAIDAAGNLFIADFGNSCVEKVTPDGVMTAIAGTGGYGFSGDGGDATAAVLDGPSGIAIDSQGNIFFSDSDNNRVRKVDTNGIITTVAGSGSTVYSGDGGAATDAGLWLPQGLAVDSSGNLYIADLIHGVIRKVDSAGIISTVAGGGQIYGGDGGPATAVILQYPYGIRLDGQGNLFIADAAAMLVRRVDPSGTITTVAGKLNTYGFLGDGGPATSASLFVPIAVAHEPLGNLVIADSGNRRIRRIDADGNMATIAGGAGYPDGTPALSASLSFPGQLTFDAAGNLFVTDTGNGRVRKVHPDGTVATVAGAGSLGTSGDGGSALAAGFGNLLSVAVDAKNNLYIGDQASIRKVNASGTITTLIKAQLQLPCTIAPTSIFLHRTGMGRIAGLAVDSVGNVYAADFDCNVIRKLDRFGAVTTVAGNGTRGYAGDNGLATDAELDQPQAVAIDRSGNIYIADSWNDRIRKIDANGYITTIAGTGIEGYSGDGGPAIDATLCRPNAIALDRDGNLYISDYSNEVIRLVTPDGNISTVAGLGYGGFYGDGGPAIGAYLDGPSGVAVRGGILYISDQFNNRIRSVAFDNIYKDGFEE